MHCRISNCSRNNVALTSTHANHTENRMYLPFLPSPACPWVGLFPLSAVELMQHLDPEMEIECWNPHTKPSTHFLLQKNCKASCCAFVKHPTFLHFNSYGKEAIYHCVFHQNIAWIVKMKAYRMLSKSFFQQKGLKKEISFLIDAYLINPGFVDDALSSLCIAQGTDGFVVVFTGWSNRCRHTRKHIIYLKYTCINGVRTIISLQKSMYFKQEWKAFFQAIADDLIYNKKNHASLNPYFKCSKHREINGVTTHFCTSFVNYHRDKLL